MRTCKDADVARGFSEFHSILKEIPGCANPKPRKAIFPHSRRTQLNTLRRHKRVPHDVFIHQALRNWAAFPKNTRRKLNLVNLIEAIKMLALCPLPWCGGRRAPIYPKKICWRTKQKKPKTQQRGKFPSSADAHLLRKRRPYYFFHHLATCRDAFAHTKNAPPCISLVLRRIEWSHWAEQRHEWSGGAV